MREKREFTRRYKSCLGENSFMICGKARLLTEPISGSGYA
jgi:hypothetical protein